MMIPVVFEPCVLLDGKGTNFATIGVTQKSDITQEHPGVILHYDDRGLVRDVIVYKNGCQTERGIGIGSSRHQVIQAYGKGKERTPVLKKGRTQIGLLGVSELIYSGIAFVFDDHGLVTMILIPPTAN